MQDEEFKKKLESILENLYKIDREVKESLDKEKPASKNQGDRREPYGNEDSKTAGNYENKAFKIYNEKQ